MSGQNNLTYVDFKWVSCLQSVCLGEGRLKGLPEDSEKRPNFGFGKTTGKNAPTPDGFVWWRLEAGVTSGWSSGLSWGFWQGGVKSNFLRPEFRAKRAFTNPLLTAWAHVLPCLSGSPQAKRGISCVMFQVWF